VTLLLTHLLPHVDTAEGGPLSPLRGRALQALKAHGLPSPKDESWRFFPVRKLTDTSFELPAAEMMQEPSPGVEATSGTFGLRLRFGRLVQTAAPLPSGLQLWVWGHSAAAPSWAQEAFLRVTGQGCEGFGAVNAVTCPEVLCLRLSGELTVPVEVLYEAAGARAPTLSSPRLIVLVDPGAKVCLIERHARGGASPVLMNSSTSLLLQQGSELTHARLAFGEGAGSELSQVSVWVDGEATYRSQVVTLGGALSRTELSVFLEGEGAKAELSGLFCASSDAEVAQHTRVVHEAPNSSSQQLYKGIVAETGKGVFDGIVRVLPAAHGTSAHQKNHNLLLGDAAVVHTKPHLEIETDDVQCTHGATVGELDEAALFYLEQRGIDPEHARGLLLYAFASELLSELPLAALRQQATRELITQLGSPASLAEMLEP
jgi:Fe-S cluster assembly protein SufD